MSVNLNVSDFSADFFTLDQVNNPTNAVQFSKGLDMLASRALDALSKPEDVELAFQRIKNANFVELSPQDKTNVDQRIQDVFNKWVKVRFGSHSRHVPRERLAKQCGPKFHAQYTSGMKEATDQELDLQSADTSSTDRCPEECKELILVYLQMGVLPPEALGDNALNMLVLAEQHQMEELTQECLDFLINNLSHDNLDTFLEFTQQTPFPPLELACLNFMKDNRDSIFEDLTTKYQEKSSIVEALAKGEITLKRYSSGIIEIEVIHYTDQTTDLLNQISKQFPITSLILSKAHQNHPFNFLKKIAPTLKGLKELVICNEIPVDRDFPKLKGLFPNLTALGNDAPFLRTFDEVKTYVGNFRKPGEDDQESNKPLLLSLNLRNVPKLTEAQLAELTPYLQELYHLIIESDKITSVVVPKATWVVCTSCTKLTTLEVPKATRIDCIDCTELTALEAPKATHVNCMCCTALTTFKAPEATLVACNDCTALTILDAPKATTLYCRRCTRLRTLKAPAATTVYSSGCTRLTALEVPEVIRLDCSDCPKLTTLKTPEATSVACSNCRALTTLEAPKEATTVYCSNCTALTTLKAPEAHFVRCDGCTKLTTLEALEATTVNCGGCKALTTLKAPEATTLFCHGCAAITSLEVLRTTGINLLHLTALTTLKTHETAETDCNGCRALTTLETHNATAVSCRGCTALTTLNAPEATSVDCDSCTKLTIFKAPKANKVFCNGFTLLRVLEAPKATEIYCSGCTTLTTLEAPKATWVECEDCTALTTLKAPEATAVYCRGCTQLTTLKVPKASLVYCCFCTALNTLEAPEATIVDCSGCTQLTTLETPEATIVDCSGCTQLTTLEVPAPTYFIGESKFIHLARILLNSIQTLLMSGYLSFFYLLDSLKNYFQSTVHTK